MDFIELQKKAHDLYYPVFLLEDFLPHEKRKKIIFWSIMGILFFGMISVFLFVLHFFVFIQFFSWLIVYQFKIYGLLCLSVSVLAGMYLLNFFYYSYLHGEPIKTDTYIDFYLAQALLYSSGSDISFGFFSTNLGAHVLLRAGVQTEDAKIFFASKKNIEQTAFVCQSSRGRISFSEFIRALCDHDAELMKFLFSYGIQKKEMEVISEWINAFLKQYEQQEYWWSKDSLQRISGIGQDWSYGRAYHLEKYQQSLPGGSFSSVPGSVGFDELQELEAVLSRAQEGDALLMGSDTTSILSVVCQLNRLIEQDGVLRDLKNKKIILFDHELFSSAHGTKNDFEKAFIFLIQEAISAGNIIFIVNNVAAWISSAESIGVNIIDICEPYFSMAALKFVFISDTDHFHGSLEKNLIISKYFEKILFKEANDSGVMYMLEREIVRYENHGFFFTYQSLRAIADSAERYFTDGIPSDKAIDLLSEIVPRLELQKKFYVEKKDILDLVQTKTGIPMGQVSVAEKDKLLNLESVLHQRIIGQKEAVSAISSAVRRARSGITNPNRPLSSFLFLGPTGVGKTETTKALADVFFGADAQIMRLDMSEYSSYDALTKLTGSFESKQEGVLSSMLREHQYGVLLLDEFEKTTSEVMNLFLQILDEGFFSDMSGKKVMARNIIIIATSNAGSDLIWNFEKQGIDVVAQKDTIINDLITRGIYKPELLNRFDGVIVFHPLTPDDLRSIATLLLGKLHTRLAERGVNLVVNDFLINFVVRHGTDPQFGARPMNRAIQEKVEQVVAEKILKSDGKLGTMIELSDLDFNEVSV